MEEIIDEKQFTFVCDAVAPYITKWFVDKGIYATTRYGYGKKGESKTIKSYIKKSRVREEIIRCILE